MAEKKSKLAEIKTKQTSASVEDFINTVKDEQKRKDSFVILEMMKRATGVNKLDDIDVKVLKEMIDTSLKLESYSK